MTITQRLSLAFATFSLALFLTGIGGIVLLSKSQARFEYVQDNTIPGITDINKTISQSAPLRTGYYKILATSDPAVRQAIQSRLEKNIDSMGQLIAYYDANDNSDDRDRQFSSQVISQLSEVRSGTAQLFSLVNAGAVEKANALLESSLFGKAEKLVGTLREQIQYKIELGSRLRSQNKEQYERALWGMVVGLVLVELCVGIFAVRIILGVRSSLRGIQNTMLDVKDSLDLTVTAPVMGNDEIGHTARAFNVLIERVAHVMSAVVISTDSVRTASQEIATGNLDLSARTEEQASSLEQTASSMSELTETVGQNAENARHANTLAVSANELVDDGNEAVQTMVATIDQINASSVRISDITTIIEGIAFQTNILALNAAVEAARAGEQGRGFAVVASEVRSLAQRSSSAAREIKDLIESSVALVREGAEQASRVGSTIADVKHAIQRLSHLVEEIASASAEQSRGIEQINQTMGQMDEVTQQNAALVEEAAAAAQSLEEQAQSLNRAVSVFRIARKAIASPVVP
jgi:methyl-accepting chemotaxis protein